MTTVTPCDVQVVIFSIFSAFSIFRELHSSCSRTDELVTFGMAQRLNCRCGMFRQIVNFAQVDDLTCLPKVVIFVKMLKMTT